MLRAWWYRSPGVPRASLLFEDPTYPYNQYKHLWNENTNTQKGIKIERTLSYYTSYVILIENKKPDIKQKQERWFWNVQNKSHLHLLRSWWQSIMKTFINRQIKCKLYINPNPRNIWKKNSFYKHDFGSKLLCKMRNICILSIPTEIFLCLM